MAELINIEGGLPTEARQARVGVTTLLRAADETMEAFQRRALRLAEETRQPFAIIGGLPEVENQEAIAGAEAHADRLADEILADPDAPNVALYAALRGLVAFAQGSGLFSVSARHMAALNRLPHEADLLAWNAREAYLTALRDAA